MMTPKDLNISLFPSSVLHIQYIFRFNNDSMTGNRLFCDITFSVAAVAFFNASSSFCTVVFLGLGMPRSHRAQSPGYGGFSSSVPLFQSVLPMQ